MKTAYFDCSCGIAGDMTVAALVDAGASQPALEEALRSLPLPGVSLCWTPTMRGGFRALHLTVEHPEQHAHRHLSDIFEILDRASLSDRARGIADELFTAIATAEARVHGSSLDEIHFHEVGAIDSIVDVTATAIAVDLLDLERCVFSPVATGYGTVRIDHGYCPIPTPGTAELLRGIPTMYVPVPAELTTPTGAAIVRVLADQFSPGLPGMTIDAIGYGAGTKQFEERANLLRVFVGEVAQPVGSEQVTLLETNLDNVTPEVLGFTVQRLQEAGALDVFQTAIQMKKSRAGMLVSVLCRPADAVRLEQILFVETGTLGIRRSELWRSVRARRFVEVATTFGPVQGKVGFGGAAGETFAPEFESCARISREQGLPLRDVYRAAEAAFQQGQHAPMQPPAVPPRSHDHDHDHRHDHDHDHRHDHDHDHRHDHDHDGGPGRRKRIHGRRPAPPPPPPPPRRRRPPSGQDHDHGHDHDHDHDHDHRHDAEDRGDHGH